jgi:hypothetical protein
MVFTVKSAGYLDFGNSSDQLESQDPTIKRPRKIRTRFNAKDHWLQIS